MMNTVPATINVFGFRDNDVEEDDTDRLVKEAVWDALRDHKQAGNPVAVWEDGKVKIIQPEDIILPDATASVSAPPR